MEKLNHLANLIDKLTAEETDQLKSILTEKFSITISITKNEVHTDGGTGDPTQPPTGPGH